MCVVSVWFTECVRIATSEMTLLSRPKLTIAITVPKANPELGYLAMTVIDTGRVCSHHLQRNVAVHTATDRRSRVKLPAGMCRARLNGTGVQGWQKQRGSRTLPTALPELVLDGCIVSLGFAFCQCRRWGSPHVHRRCLGLICTNSRGVVRRGPSASSQCLSSIQAAFVTTFAAQSIRPQSHISAQPHEASRWYGSSLCACHEGWKIGKSHSATVPLLPDAGICGKPPSPTFRRSPGKKG